MSYHKLKNKDQEIIQKYQCGATSEELAKLYGCDPSAILYRLKKHNIPRHKFTDLFRKHSCNQHFFDNIDSEEKAYFLGFLYADGYNNESRNQIAISLQERDRDILEKMNKLIHPNKKLAFYKQKVGQNVYKLLICSEHMSQQLKSLGMFQKKSLTLKWPTNHQVPNSLIRHFIRGLFDGDGYISLDKTMNCATVSMVGSEDINKHFINIISSNCNIYKPKLIKYKNIYRSKFHTKYGILDIYNFLYKDATIFLQRKSDKFLEFLHFHNIPTN